MLWSWRSRRIEMMMTERSITNYIEPHSVNATAILKNAAGAAPPLPATTFNGVFDMSQRLSSICTLVVKHPGITVHIHQDHCSRR